MKFLRDSNSVWSSLLVRISFLYKEDTFLKKLFKACMHKELDLEDPQTYSEKLQWLKLYNRRPYYPSLVDKYEVKEFVSKVIGEEFIIPTIGVWNNFDEIDFTELPGQFVLKTTNGGGSTGVVICKDKNNFDYKSARKKLNKSMHSHVDMGEWPYKNVKPRIIAEQYMEDKETGELRDYKFFCFNGVVKALFIATDRGVVGDQPKFDFYDADFNHLPFKQGHPHQKNKIIHKPDNFELMKELAAKLSKGEPHERIDLYEINGKVYFGEITFFHFGGIEPFDPEEWDYTFGSWLSLPQKQK